MESTVFRKMRLQEGARGIALNAPPEFHEMAARQRLVAFPSSGPYDFALLFAASIEEYRARAVEAREALSQRGRLWVAFPRPRGVQPRTFGWHALWLTARREGLEEMRGIPFDDAWVVACFRQAVEKR
ncbi:hypothetical protein [Gordonibacter massiliensis (ex Traore et al. 2017)]|uniref:hypothetical protein n=1 Tax=Gordonibacter massiliensis (ex Traore et al. 2017) TaxID=1841863 RepID=UPI001C8C2548|nr:hypothetical protein [Gordonibacter massiliensis (ex Traore et al. 2017)]MBX9034553.1 hypothetical protein [Gordonibacter massiliensis (ex Traore et al. 2017)]